MSFSWITWSSSLYSITSFFVISTIGCCFCRCLMRHCLWRCVMWTSRHMMTHSWQDRRFLCTYSTFSQGHWFWTVHVRERKWLVALLLTLDKGCFGNKWCSKRKYQVEGNLTHKMQQQVATVARCAIEMQCADPQRNVLLNYKTFKVPSMLLWHTHKMLYWIL